MLAAHLLDTIPNIMREWRRELHYGLPEGININQFRVLFFVGLGHNSSAYLARQFGVSPAAMSKMVDCLVQSKLLARKTAQTDRRQVVLSLTKNGQNVVKRVRRQVETRLESYLLELNQQEQKQVELALNLLQKVFSSNPESAL